MLKFLGDAIEVDALAHGDEVLVNGRAVPVAAPDGLAGPVKIYARPWHLHFVEDDTAHIKGVVQSSYRTQGRQNIEVLSAEGKTFVVEAADNARLDAGSTVSLRIDKAY